MPGQVFSYFTYNYSNSLFKGRDMSFCLRPHKIQHMSVRDDSDLSASVPQGITDCGNIGTAWNRTGTAWFLSTWPRRNKESH